MVYSKPHYFLGQQDAGLPLKGRSQSVLDSRRYSGGHPRVFVHSPAPNELPSPPKPVQKNSTLKSEGERLIRFEDSTTTDSESTETIRRPRPMPHVNIEDRSSRQSPRRTSRSPSRHHSSSPPRRGASPYWRSAPSHDYKNENYVRSSSLRRYSPRPSSSSSTSTSSFDASVPSSSYFQTEFSEGDSSTSSGYDSGAFDWRNYHSAQYLGPSPSRSSRIIMLKPRSGRSPLQNLVSNHRHCEQHHNKCNHEACHHRCDHCKSAGCHKPVSRRSRATSRILPGRPSSNLSFFEETILPGPNMPLLSVIPLRYDGSETCSDSSSSYYGPSRNYLRGASHVRAPAHTRLNDNLEKWLNDALKSSYSPPTNSNFGVCRGRAL